eukprot:364266-Chlamydomonas_euryale.AAC.2
MQDVTWARALDGSEYMPGLVGLNNMRMNDYANVVVHILSRVVPVRYAGRYSNDAPRCCCCCNCCTRWNCCTHMFSDAHTYASAQSSVIRHPVPLTRPLQRQRAPHSPPHTFSRSRRRVPHPSWAPNNKTSCRRRAQWRRHPRAIPRPHCLSALARPVDRMYKYVAPRPCNAIAMQMLQLFLNEPGAGRRTTDPYIPNHYKSLHAWVRSNACDQHAGIPRRRQRGQEGTAKGDGRGGRKVRRKGATEGDGRGDRKARRRAVRHRRAKSARRGPEWRRGLEPAWQTKVAFGTQYTPYS